MCGNQLLKLVERDLLLVAPVRLHPPDLHVARAVGVEVDPLAVRRQLRAVVDAFGRGQPDFLAAIDGDLVEVELAVALPGVEQPLLVGRPAVEVRRRVRGDALRLATGRRQHPDHRTIAVGRIRLALLMPIIVPSNDSTWSLLLRVTDPVSMSATACREVERPQLAARRCRSASCRRWSSSAPGSRSATCAAPCGARSRCPSPRGCCRCSRDTAPSRPWAARRCGRW